MGWVSVIVSALVAILKGIFGTDRPQKQTVFHPEPQVEVGDGKSDAERLKDLGL